MLKATYIPLTLLLFFSFNPFKLHANVNPNDSIKFLIETKVHYGFVIAHHKSMVHLQTGHFPAFELNFGKQTNGDKKWQALYKFPVIGISCWYADLANPAVLGSSFALFPFMNFHLTQSQRFLLNFRFGVGLGYLTKKFDRINNYKNNAIGSNFNVCINLFYELKFRLSKKLFITGGIGLTHFSNGALNAPNLGINIPTINAGFAYSLNTGSSMKIPPDVKINKEEKKIEIQAFLSGGMKESFPDIGHKYGCYSLSACFLKPLSLKRKIGLGIDLFWEFSNRTDPEVKHDYQFLAPGIHIGHQLEFSRLSFINQIGAYIYNINKSDGLIYLRTALRYKLTDKLLINLALKTHWTKADFVEFGLGYQLK